MKKKKKRLSCFWCGGDWVTSSVETILKKKRNRFEEEILRLVLDVFKLRHLQDLSDLE